MTKRLLYLSFLFISLLSCSNEINWGKVSKWQEENKGVEETLGKIFLSSEIYAKVGKPLGLEGYYADQLEGLTESEISVIYYRGIMGTYLSANGYKSSGQDVINNYKKHLDDLGIDYDKSISYKPKKTKKLNDKPSVTSGKKGNIPDGGGDCNTRDNNFIINKMKQMNRDVISIQNAGNRKYFVQYVDWRTGRGNSGSTVLDYSNSPCD
tara:strand:+ start:1045 stop:1671 length:627 start_codon:yes stop_codon:yes gene_type:complete